MKPKSPGEYVMVHLENGRHEFCSSGLEEHIGVSASVHDEKHGFESRALCHHNAAVAVSVILAEEIVRT